MCKTGNNSFFLYQESYAYAKITAFTCFENSFTDSP